MSWTAVVPMKQGPERKSRLASRLSDQTRATLSDHMAAHVLECLNQSPSIGRIVILSPTPVADGRFAWAQDQGRGLNEELTAFRTSEPAQSMIFIHGDLPLLVPEEIEALIQAAGGGCALAPDRHGSGTNAIALTAAAPFEFAFGENSLALHQATSGRRAAIVRRLGLSLDVDTPDDLDAAIAAGFSMPN